MKTDNDLASPILIRFFLAKYVVGTELEKSSGYPHIVFAGNSCKYYNKFDYTTEFFISRVGCALSRGEKKEDRFFGIHSQTNTTKTED